MYPFHLGRVSSATDTSQKISGVKSPLANNRVLRDIATPTKLYIVARDLLETFRLNLEKVEGEDRRSFAIWEASGINGAPPILVDA